MSRLTKRLTKRKQTRTNNSKTHVNYTMGIMNGMVAGKIPRIKKKMGKPKLKIIETEMEQQW
jgi:hypothetical protein